MISASNVLEGIIFVIVKLSCYRFGIHLIPIVMMVITSSFAQWQPTGGPTYRHDVAISNLCVSGENIFIPMDWNGFRRSTDFGRSWMDSDTGIPEGCVWCVAAKADTLYAGCPDGVYYSADSGATWQRAGKNNALTYPSFQVRSLFICGNTMFTMRTTDFTGMCRSVDNGETWTSCPGYGTQTPYVMAAHGKTLFAGNNQGVFRSADDGALWSLRPEIDDEVWALAVTGNNLLAAGLRTGLYRSTDDGVHWRSVDSLLLGIKSFAVIGDTILAATYNSVLISTDSGTTWTPLDFKLPKSRIQSLYVRGRVILAEVADTIYMSKNRGADWTEVNCNVPFTVARYIVTNGSTVVVGLKSMAYYGLHRSTDNGTTWTMISNGPQESNLMTLFMHANGVFAVYTDSMRRSFDGGGTWTTFMGRWSLQSPLVNGNIGLYTSTGTAMYAAVIKDIVGDFRYIYQSTDSGATWVPTSGSGLPDARIQSLAANGNVLYAGTGAGLFRSSDNGSNWIAVNTGVPNRSIGQLATRGTTIAFVDAEKSNGICFSTDNGRNWTEVTGLSGSIRSIALSNAFMFVMTIDGVFQVAYNGADWVFVNTNLILSKRGYCRYTSIAVNDSYLFASIADDRKGYGVWRRPLSDFPLATTTPGGRTPVQQGLRISTSGNAGLKTIAISFYIPRGGKVAFSLCTISGRVIRSIHGRSFEAGSHMFMVDGRSLPAGLYLVTMETPENRTTGVFTCIR
jgi:photosystem II stability/assembly factor-like uncharacterized protein